MFSPVRNGQIEISFKIDMFAGNQEQLEIAKAIAGADGTFTREALLEFLASNLDRGLAIRQMLDSSPPGEGDGVAAFRARQGQRVDETVDTRSKEEIDRIMQVVDQLIIGQQHVKDWVRRTLEARPENPEEALPFLLGMAGPPGVGKTELFRALATAMFGSPDSVVIIRGGELKTVHDVNVLLGAAPGLVESDKTTKISQLSSREMDEKFGNRGPKLILFDECDKIGDGKPEVITSIMNALGSIIEDGIVRLKNGDIIDLRDSIMGFASNAGMEEDKGKTGDDARKHYVDAFRRMVPKHIASRVADVLGFDPHTPASVAQVARKLIENEIELQLSKARLTRGVEGKIDLGEDLLKFIGECTYHREYGARPAKTLVRSLIEPEVRRVARSIKDEEVYKFDLAPIDEQQKNILIGAFQKEGGSVPQGVNIKTFPMVDSIINPKPEFFSYAADEAIPHDPKRPLLVFGSGAVGGQGFLVSKPNEREPAALHFLRAGVKEKDDTFETPAVEMPEKLAAANNDLKVTNLDKDHLLFIGVTAPEKGNLAESVAYVFNAKTGEWKEAAPPDVPLVGAALVGDRGKAVLFGGRVQEKRKSGWTVTNDPRQMNGVAIENQAYVYDMKKNEWRWIEGAPSEGVVAAATVAKDGKGYIIGGEELFTPLHSPLLRSQASKNVWVFDFETEKFSKGPSLKNGVAFATAFVNANGNVQVLGGATYAGRDLVEVKMVSRLVNDKWRDETMPNAGLCLSAIPEVPNAWVIGPFARKNGTFGFDVLRPSEG
jgi:DNA polymerase III delta prime subunit